MNGRPPGGFWSGMWWFLAGKWPTERQWVTIWIFFLLIGMLTMAWIEPSLWEIERFNTVLQAVAITGLINMVLAFHFSANQGTHQSSENTGKAMDAIRSVAERDKDRPTGKPDDPVHVEDDKR